MFALIQELRDITMDSQGGRMPGFVARVAVPAVRREDWLDKASRERWWVYGEESMGTSGMSYYVRITSTAMESEVKHYLSRMDPKGHYGGKVDVGGSKVKVPTPHRRGVTKTA